ncbi:MAG: right-handed parallel beta-helix repeat-containing protein [Fuerstiella sp.]
MTTYYVDGVSGSDANDGLSVGTAWQTIQKVFNEVGVTLTTHDDVRIMATADYDLAGTGLNSSTNFLGAIVGANAAGVVDGTRAKITTTVAQQSLLEISSSLTAFAYLDFDGNSLTTHALSAATVNCRNFWFHCLFHDAIQAGSYQGYAGGQCRHRFLRCEFFNNGADGVYGRGATIIECEIHDNVDAGIFGNQSDAVHVGNRIYANGIGLEGLSSAEGIFFGNTIDDCDVGLELNYNSGSYAGGNQITNCGTSIKNLGTLNYLYHFSDNLHGNTGRSSLGAELSFLETAVDPAYNDPSTRDYDYSTAAAADALAPFTLYVGAGTYLLATGGGGSPRTGFGRAVRL